MNIVQAIFCLSFNEYSFLRDEKTRCGVCFVFAKDPTEGMAKKVEVQEKRKIEGLLRTFSCTLTFKRFS